jgi:hypothetical protein
MFVERNKTPYTLVENPAVSVKKANKMPSCVKFSHNSILDWYGYSHNMKQVSGGFGTQMLRSTGEKS